MELSNCHEPSLIPRRAIFVSPKIGPQASAPRCWLPSESACDPPQEIIYSGVWLRFLAMSGKTRKDMILLQSIIVVTNKKLENYWVFNYERCDNQRKTFEELLDLSIKEPSKQRGLNSKKGCQSLQDGFQDRGDTPKDYPNNCHLLILRKLMISHGNWGIYHVLWGCIEKNIRIPDKTGKSINKHRLGMYHSNMEDHPTL